jgi:MFS family permease
VAAALGACAYLLLAPHSADLAAQQYRAGLVRDGGLGLWDNGWFAGHHTPAYSLLSPALGAAIGVGLGGALSAVVAAALFAALAQRHWGERAGTFAALWFAAGVTATLFSGRLAFLLGIAVAMAAMLALQSARPAAAAALALVTTLASPVAGLFVAVAAVAWGLRATFDAAPPSKLDPRRWWGAAIAAAALLPAVALAVAFPEGGSEPFVASAFWPALLAIALVAAALPRRERTLRAGAALYALLCVAAFAVASPLGGNVTRLGALLAGPVLAGALLGARPRHSPALLLALGLGLAYWQAYPAVRDVVRASGDPSTAAAYHAPLIGFLERRRGSFRVEIPFTANHWEAAYVAPHVALARGWERQLDRRYGALFYDGSLDAATYRAWLAEHAVAYVALPDAALDYSAKAEARLIERGLPYLRPVWRDEHWRVFAVRRPAPLADGVAGAIALTPDGFDMRARRAGDALVRVRHTRWWSVTGGRACVERGPGAMTRVHALGAGVVRVRASLSGSRCRR